MAYGILKCDTVTFTDAGVDKSVSISGLVQNPTFSGNVTVTGTLSGVTVTGTTANFTSGNFTNISGGTHTITSGVFAAGSAASPSITFTGDLNTGIYSPGADQVAISTGGSGRLFINSTGSLGIGAALTYSSYFPNAAVFNNQGVFFADGSLNYFRTGFGNNILPSGPDAYINIRSRGWGFFAIQDDVLTYSSGSSGTAGSSATGSERFRIDSSGRLGVGTSSPSGLLTLAWNSSAGINAGLIGQVNNSAGANNGYRIGLRTSSDATNWCSIDQAFDNLGGSAGTYIAFTTTSGYTPAERMRLTGTGLGVGTTPSTLLHIQSTDPAFRFKRSDAGTDAYGELTTDTSGLVTMKCDPANAAAGSGFRITVDNSEALRVDSSGRLGIGTSSPGESIHTTGKLRVGDGGNYTVAAVQLGSSNANGISYPGTNILNFITNSTAALTIDASQRVGIGTTSPGGMLHVAGATILGDNGTNGRFTIETNTSRVALLATTTGFGAYQNLEIYGAATIFHRANLGEAARIDSSGRLLVGTSSASVSCRAVFQANSSGGGTGIIYIASGTNTPGNGDAIGAVLFSDSTQVESAFVSAQRDGGTWSGSSKPTRLVFSTTADGASSPTERLRISQSGVVEAATQINVRAFGTGVASVGITTGVQVDATADATDCFRVFRVGVGQTFNVTGAGAVSKASGSFKISHPLPEKTDTHYLVHSFIEGPQADLIYRGHVALTNGAAQVNIDEAGRMTEGTFEALCTNVCCFTSNETDWTPVRGRVDGNILTIEAQDPTSTAEVCWMVIGERKDKHMLETDWTDESGRVITEPLKEPMPEFVAEAEAD